MLQKIRFYLDHPKELEELTRKGRWRVLKDGYDYETILRGLAERTDLGTIMSSK
jgi:spore maturation protein CgeB